MDSVGWHGAPNSQGVALSDPSGVSGGAGGQNGLNSGLGAHRGGNGVVGSVQDSVNRLSALSMANQSGFGHLGMGGLGQSSKMDIIQQHKGRMMQNQQQLGGKGAGLPGMHETEYTDQLLSELQWAQQAPMHGQQPSNNCIVSPLAAEFTSHLPPALGGGGAQVPSQHAAAYDFAGFKRDMLPGQLGGGRVQYGNGMPGNTPHIDSIGMLGSTAAKRPRVGVAAPHGRGVDPYMLMDSGGGHPGQPQGAAHKDALMELARENLILKHQLQSATLEVTRLRQACDKYQQDVDESGDSCKNVQSRYWTDEEHHRFLEAIQKFGHKDVKAISSFVGSRNATQVRTHAQKYFMRMARSNKARGGGSLRAFDIGGGSSEAGGTDLDSDCAGNMRSGVLFFHACSRPVSRARVVVCVWCCL